MCTGLKFYKYSLQHLSIFDLYTVKKRYNYQNQSFQDLLYAFLHNLIFENSDFELLRFFDQASELGTGFLNRYFWKFVYPISCFICGSRLVEGKGNKGEGNQTQGEGKKQGDPLYSPQKIKDFNFKNLF